MLENIKILLNYGSFSSNEIFSKLVMSNMYNQLPFLEIINNFIKSSECTDKTYIYAINISNMSNVLSAQELENLNCFFQGFGKSDIDGQLALCNYYINIFGKSLTSKEENEKEKCRSLTAMIMGTVTGIIILLI